MSFGLRFPTLRKLRKMSYIYTKVSGGRVACSHVLAASGGEFTQPLPPLLWEKRY